MNVGEMIEMLQDAVKGGLDSRNEVQTFDPDTAQWESVTGMTYGGEDGLVRLYTDSDDEQADTKIERKKYAGQHDRPVHSANPGTGGQGDEAPGTTPTSKG